MSKDQSLAATQAEIKNALERRNSVSAFYSVIGLVVLIPVFMLIVKFSGFYEGHTIPLFVFLTACEVLQIGCGFLAYFLTMAGETEKMEFFNKLYYYGTSVALLFAARAELAYSGNYFIYALAAMFASIGPVWQTVDRRFFMYPIALVFLITAATAGAGWAKFAIVAALAACMIGLSVYIQKNVVDHEKLALRLRAKTLSSERDPLTKLTNRRGLDRQCAVLWPYCARTATPIGVIEIDIDFFKKYNDRFGHPAGDKCLKKVASAIRNSAKRATDISARIGGEEFVVFVQGMSEKEMVALAMKIRSNVDALKIPHAYAGVSKYVTVSMGVGIITPDSSNSFENLYEAADKALYQAKENGRNCVVCNGRIYGKMRGGLPVRVSGM